MTGRGILRIGWGVAAALLLARAGGAWAQGQPPWARGNPDGLLWQDYVVIQTRTMRVCVKRQVDGQMETTFAPGAEGVAAARPTPEQKQLASLGMTVYQTEHQTIPGSWLKPWGLRPGQIREIGAIPGIEDNGVGLQVLPADLQEKVRKAVGQWVYADRAQRAERGRELLAVVEAVGGEWKQSRETRGKALIERTEQIRALLDEGQKAIIKQRAEQAERFLAAAAEAGGEDWPARVPPEHGLTNAAWDQRAAGMYRLLVVYVNAGGLGLRAVWVPAAPGGAEGFGTEPQAAAGGEGRWGVMVMGRSLAPIGVDGNLERMLREVRADEKGATRRYSLHAHQVAALRELAEEVIKSEPTIRKTTDEIQARITARAREVWLEYAKAEVAARPEAEMKLREALAALSAQWEKEARAPREPCYEEVRDILTPAQMKRIQQGG